MITIRKYMPEDWEAVAGIHDEARRVELKLAGLEEAFLPFSIASEQESFLNIPEFLWRNWKELWQDLRHAPRRSLPGCM